MNTSIEGQKVMIDLTIKLAFKNAMSLIPVAGPLLSDVLFEYRGKIKEVRLLKFLDLLKDEFSKANADLDIDNVTSEDFSDLLENVLLKVTKTKNDRKIAGFKNLLLHGMSSNSETDECEIFSEVLFSLNSRDISILEKHESYLFHGSGLLKRKSDLQRELEDFLKNKKIIELQQSWIPQPEYVAKPRTEIDIQSDLIQVKEMIINYRKSVNCKSLGIAEGQYIYSTQSLYNKGLLVDEGVGSVGTRPFEIMALTDFGRKFLQFIKYA